jgi:hypothetical protein
MKNVTSCILLALAIWLMPKPSASQPTVTVKAGTKIIDYFPQRERYRYPAFIDGIAVFKGGTYTESRFNYNVLYGAMEFIQKGDTLAIANANQIKMVIIETDTFYFDNGYLEVLFSNGSCKLALKDYVKIVDTKKQAAYGMTSSTGSITSYSSISSSPGSFYKLVVNDDLVVRKEKEYYLYTPENGFLLFKKSNLMQSFPGKEDEIKQYLKQNKVDFGRESDLMDLMKFLASK